MTSGGETISILLLLPGPKGVCVQLVLWGGKPPPPVRCDLGEDKSPDKSFSKVLSNFES